MSSFAPIEPAGRVGNPGVSNATAFRWLSLWERCCLFCSLLYVLQTGRCLNRFCDGLVCQQDPWLVLGEGYIFRLCCFWISQQMSPTDSGYKVIAITWTVLSLNIWAGTYNFMPRLLPVHNPDALPISNWISRQTAPLLLLLGQIWADVGSCGS